MSTSSNHPTNDELYLQAFLQRRGYQVNQLRGFYFMQRRPVHPDKHSDANPYGPGLLTLVFHDGHEATLRLHLRHRPTTLISGLLHAHIPFLNLADVQRDSSAPQPVKRYHRVSLYMIWQFALFLSCLAFGFYFSAQTQSPYRLLLSVPFFAGGLYSLYLLQARFCYVRLDEKALTVISAGRSIRYLYCDLLKVNFDFAREANATHVMELLDADFGYHLYYIGRTPRRSLPEITRRLQQAGIDATCSLNHEKKHYHDVYHAQ